MDSYKIIKTIAEAKKKTPAKIYLQGELGKINFGDLDFYGSPVSGILFCEYSDFEKFYEQNKKFITKYKMEVDRRNSAILMADLTKYSAESERLIMMGAVSLLEPYRRRTMIDMNVVGGKPVWKNCHIGAATVLAGVIEPPSADQ
jgi:tetrahydrodipicolinate N-succinyltransferase